VQPRAARCGALTATEKQSVQRGPWSAIGAFVTLLGVTAIVLRTLRKHLCET
jgi:hypothetical protein